jgi:hypothetical protein
LAIAGQGDRSWLADRAAVLSGHSIPSIPPSRCPVLPQVCAAYQRGECHYLDGLQGGSNWARRLRHNICAALSATALPLALTHIAGRVSMPHRNLPLLLAVCAFVVIEQGEWIKS